MRDCLTLSDSELSVLLINADHKAYAQLYQRYFRLLYSYAYKKLRDEEQAKDIIQEFFTSLLHKRESTVFSTNIAGYFFLAVNNRIINYFPHETVKSKYLESFASFLNVETDTTDHLIREKQLLEMINREIRALPVKMREMFELSRKQHFPIKRSLNN
ncbi:sigma-70 family RNA polymerase sigma factor [Mucilaginibacter sp.]|uniref:RNA polymerase sigma factor n=1 Tax=Mucilaginibacter sp. TaxID=1882438 RepID=UPI00284BB369|nr:sigma-70 family RNA polymerase sigma factor [Mucilaginibacter sp.]MDR3696032.1 sigma-70 family RNA polymerase sigma factor [Mucilaginibacter sp.]